MIEKTNWKNILDSLEHYLSEYKTGITEPKNYAYEGLKKLINSNSELAEKVWGLDENQYNQDDFKWLV